MTSTVMRTTKTFGLIAAALTLAAGHAAAAEATYVGTWASDLAQCKLDQDRQEAPLILAKDRYDQHETHCTFSDIKKAPGEGSEWKISSKCTIEGSEEPYDFALTVSGDTLTVTDDAGSRDLLLCK